MTLIKCYHGSAAVVLRERIAAASVDMAYSDPPFGNNQDWKGKAGSFSDKWSKSASSDAGWAALSGTGAKLMSGICRGAAERAYIGSIAAILVECHRVLKPTGTLWLHFDDTMGAQLRMLCDVIFGVESAAGTLVWQRTVGAHGNAKGFGRIHDTIAAYARTRAAFWRLWRLGTLGGDPLSGDGLQRFSDFAVAPPLAQSAKERVGYPTQKPVALLEELIGAATLPGDLVLDPTCGSGTTLVAAANLGRSAIGIDQSGDAIETSRKRLSMRAPKQTELFGVAA